MSHLGLRVTALADGQLPAAEAERAFAHIAGCERCARELAEARSARAALSGAPDITPDPSLTARLLAMCPPVAAPQGDPVRYAPPSLAMQRGLDEVHGGVRRRSRWTKATALVVTAGGVLSAGLFVLGSGPIITPSLHPADPLTVLGRADRPAASGGTVVAAAVAGDALDWINDHGWRCPDTLPAGYMVSGVLLEDDGTMLELALAGGAEPTTIVVRERVGRLNSDALAGMETTVVDGQDIYVVSDEPWHLVWQSGSIVVDLVADAPQHVVLALVAAFPDGGYDSGIPARIERGWTTMTGAFGTS